MTRKDYILITKAITDTQKRITLDEAVSTFRDMPDAETAQVLRDMAEQYHDDGMIEAGTWSAYFDETEPYLKESEKDNSQPIADDVRDIVATAILNASRNHNGLTNLGNISAVLSRAQAYNAADAALEALSQSAPSSGDAEAGKLAAQHLREAAHTETSKAVHDEETCPSNATHEIIYLQFSDCGQNIRKWSRTPFDGGRMCRVQLAVAEWSKAVADEGDRATPLSQPSTPAGEDMLTDLRMSLEALVAGEASVDETEYDILNLPEFRQSDAAEIARLRVPKWTTPSEEMPPLHTQVLVALRGGVGGVGEVLDVACYIGKQDDGAGKQIDRWILADVRLDARQIVGWMHILTASQINERLAAFEALTLQAGGQSRLTDPEL